MMMMMMKKLILKNENNEVDYEILKNINDGDEQGILKYKNTNVDTRTKSINIASIYHGNLSYNHNINNYKRFF